MIVIDCSALVHALTDIGPRGKTVRERLTRADELAVPHLLDVELASALLGLARGRRGGEPRLSRTGLEAAMESYRELPLERFPAQPLWPRLLTLSHNLSVYDATYVALAEALDAPLITSDARIDRSGAARCTVETL